jgi:hypothetical protein
MYGNWLKCEVFCVGEGEISKFGWSHYVASLEFESVYDYIWIEKLPGLKPQLQDVIVE